MRHTPAWIIPFAVTLLAGCVTTPPADPLVTAQAPAVLAVEDVGMPAYKIGDRWEYSDGYGLEVTKVDYITDLTTMAHLEKNNTSLTSDWIQRKGIFRESSRIGNELRQDVFHSRPPEKDLFPLAIGKQSRYKREYLVNDKDLKEHQTSWQVTGRDTIEVPAGRFDVWVIDYETHSITTDWQGRERWYYSPQIKQYVRLEYQYGKAPPSSRVLMRYKLAP